MLQLWPGLCTQYWSAADSEKGAHSYFSFLHLHVLNDGGKITHVFPIQKEQPFLYVLGPHWK